MKPVYGRGDTIVRWFKIHKLVIRRVVTGVFVLVVLLLIGIAAASIQWLEVLSAIRKLPGVALAQAALLAFTGYMACACFDVLGKWYTGHPLAVWKPMLVGFISYALTINLNTAVGAGIRLRLYIKQGLTAGIVMRVIAFSLATNWIGYSLLAGLVFVSGSVRLPSSWSVGNDVLRVVGAVMVLAVLVYLYLCAFSKVRSWTIREHRIELPTLGLGGMQVCLAFTSWSLMAAIIYVLLQQEVAYFLVLGVLLISAIAGALAHIPGGLGVTESVFIALLGYAVPRPELLGALLVYRAIYYLAPLLIASLMYLWAETYLGKVNQNSIS